MTGMSNEQTAPATGKKCLKVEYHNRHLVVGRPDEPRWYCRKCLKVEYCNRHLRAEFPPFATKRALKRRHGTCTGELEYSEGFLFLPKKGKMGHG